MAFEKSGTHFVIARNEKEAARNVLTYPHAVEDDYSVETAAARLHGVREQFGEEFDVFLVRTQIHVDAKASELLGSCPNKEE
jgi:hypothetical protein